MKKTTHITFDAGATVGTFVGFQDMVAKQVEAFPENPLLVLLDKGQLQLPHYQRLLLTLFHQTYSSPYTFARAGANCPWRYADAKEYLIRHAEEERVHWRWIIDDLAAISYTGPSPRGQTPPASAIAYIGLNYIVAEEFPVARLAVASVLEGIGAAHGGAYGEKMLKQLRLSKSHASFFLSHGETDKTHSVELIETLSRCDLSANEWGQMTEIAERTGSLYRGMYSYASEANT